MCNDPHFCIYQICATSQQITSKWSSEVIHELMIPNDTLWIFDFSRLGMHFLLMTDFPSCRLDRHLYNLTFSIICTSSTILCLRFLKEQYFFIFCENQCRKWPEIKDIFYSDLLFEYIFKKYVTRISFKCSSTSLELTTRRFLGFPVWWNLNLLGTSMCQNKNSAIFILYTCAVKDPIVDWIFFSSVELKVTKSLRSFYRNVYKFSCNKFGLRSHFYFLQKLISVKKRFIVKMFHSYRKKELDIILSSTISLLFLNKIIWVPSIISKYLRVLRLPLEALADICTKLGTIFWTLCFL